MVVLDHVQATEMFSAYWEKDLPADQIRALEEHLQSCVVCKKEYQTFERTVGALSGLHKMAAPAEFSDDLRGRIYKRSRGRFFSPKRTGARVPWEVISIVMLGVILAIYVVLTLGEPQKLHLP